MLSYGNIAAAVLLLASTSTMAVAQTGAAAAAGQGVQPAAQSAQTAGGLEDIIVTAQRRGENLQRVPIAVSAVTATQLQATGISGTADIKLAVPSADVGITNGYATPFIRGVGSKAVGPATESPVSTYIDNVYIGNSAGALLAFNNIERIEVLKGPQGTLFGRNATGGLISIITRDPSDQLEGNVRVGYSNYNTIQGDFYIGGPIAGAIKADLAGYGLHQGDGWGTNFFNGRDVGRTDMDVGLRSKWLYENGPLTARIIADWTKLRTSTNVQRIAFGSTTPPPYGPVYGGSPWDTDLSVQPEVNNQGGGVSLKVDYELNPMMTFTSITAWRKNRYQNIFDSDITRVDGRETYVDQVDEQFSQEVQLLSGRESPFTWVVGAFLYDAQGRYEPSRLTVNGPSRGAFAQSFTFATQDVLSIAPYAQGTVEIFDATKLTLGARYTYEKRVQDGEQQSFSPTGAQVGATATIHQKLVAKKLTWRVALDHQFTPDILSYASYNRGFKSGGANLTSVTAAMYRPEQLDAFELGLKSTLFDRRVRFNGAAFYYDYKNIQVLTVNSGIITIYNGAAARTYGLELELDTQVTEQLRLNAGYTYLDAKFTDFANAVTNLPNPEGGTRQLLRPADGNRLPNAPQSVITAGFTYTVPIGSNFLALNGSVYHNSGYFGEPDNFRRQGSYELYNASLEYRLGDVWTFTLWGKNLSNKAVNLYPSAAGVGGVSSLGGNRAQPRSSYAPPRTYGITVGAKF